MKQQTYADVNYEVLDDNILSYTILSPTSRAFAEWAEVSVDNLRKWPKDRPCLIIHDISRSGLGLLYCTAVKDDIFNVAVIPEKRPQVEEILRENPDWQVALAVVVSASLSGHLSRLLFAERTDNHVMSKAFFQRSAAIKWLKSLDQGMT